MSQSVRSGLTRSLRLVSIVVLVSHLMVVAAVSQEKPQVVTIPEGNAAVMLPGGNQVQDAPVPDLPYDGNQHCPPWSTMYPPAQGKYLPCSVVAQAGVPFRGWIATQALCNGDHIDAIIARNPFQTAGPMNDPSYPTPPSSQDMDIYYFPNGSWPEKEHLGGIHVWEDPGQYSFTGVAWTDCLRPYGIHWFFNFPISSQSTPVMVYEPTAPQSITASGKASVGQPYPHYGKVTLFDAAPASGSLVKLTIEKLGLLDLITPFGRTGLQEAGSGIFYVSTYVYVPAGQTTADFDVVVAASAPVGDTVKIFAKCVGIPGNWRINNHCNEVNKQPQVLKVTITP